MLLINHRINTIQCLSALPKGAPVEIDVHAYGDRLIVQHDAKKDGVELSDWLSIAGRRFVVLNIKEEGIEDEVLSMVKKSALLDFFLLDITFPTLIKMVRRGEKRVALRVSEYESFRIATDLKGKIGWVWLDCFNGFPLNKLECKYLSESGAKICLVSPELHGNHRSRQEIYAFKSILKDYDFKVHAVCTKQPEIWRAL